jgi:hypothetical protein
MARKPVREARNSSEYPYVVRLAIIAAALDRLDPDCCYQDWFSIGASIYTVTEGSEDGLELLDRWSRQGGTYPGRRKMEQRWSSYRNLRGELKLGTLAHLVKREGGNWAAVLAEVRGSR